MYFSRKKQRGATLFVNLNSLVLTSIITDEVRFEMKRYQILYAILLFAISSLDAVWASGNPDNNAVNDDYKQVMPLVALPDNLIEKADHNE